MEEGLEIGASGAVAFFDSDALKPLAAACLLSARSRRGAVEWTGALSVITQLVPKSDTTLCTVRQAQCSEVSERATRGNCMPAGPAPSPSIRAPASAERAAASTQAGPRCRCRWLSLALQLVACSGGCCRRGLRTTVL